MADKTTVVQFKADPDWFFESVRAWVLSITDFRIEEKRENYRLYSGRSGGIGGRCWLVAKHDGQTATLEAWIGHQKKGRMHLTGGLGGAVPKRRYRQMFNKLLDMLDEPRV
jgi:hypothetical protein